LFTNPKKHGRFRSSNGCSKIKAVAVSEEEEEIIEGKSVKVKATVTVQPTVGGLFSEMAIERGLDDITDLLGKSILLELCSSQLDPGKLLVNLIKLNLYIILQKQYSITFI
jgi:lipoxygenase